MYPKGLARGDCIQRPPDREVQIPRGLKGQQGVSQEVGKGNSKGKSTGQRQANAMAKAMAEAKAMANGKDQRPNAKSKRYEAKARCTRQGRHAKGKAKAKARAKCKGKCNG